MQRCVQRCVQRSAAFLARAIGPFRARIARAHRLLCVRAEARAPGAESRKDITMNALRWAITLGAVGLVTTVSGAAHAAPHSYALGPYVVGPLADFTHDGLADFADQNAADGSFWVHKNNGAGGFSAANYDHGSTPCTGGFPAACDVMVADFTGDGFADYADRDRKTGQFWVHANRTHGGFDSANWGTGQTGTGTVLVADFTGDGYADFADLDSHGVMSIHENFGYLGSPAHFGAPNNKWFVKTVGSTDVLVGDFNGDKFADYAVLNTRTGFYDIHLNLGTSLVFTSWGGMMYVPQGFSDSAWSAFPACSLHATGECQTLIGDFNGDQLADWADQDLATGVFKVHLNRGIDNTVQPARGAGFASAVFESGRACVPTAHLDGTPFPAQTWCGIFGQDGAIVSDD
jgi:hypothetical protein